jgi:hypothetical protein
MNAAHAQDLHAETYQAWLQEADEERAEAGSWLQEAELDMARQYLEADSQQEESEQAERDMAEEATEVDPLLEDRLHVLALLHLH